MSKTLVIKLTCGADAPERAAQGLTVAAMAVASGHAVSLWLTGESAWFATPAGVGFDLEHSPDLDELLQSVIEGGSVTLCTQCAARRSLNPGDLRPGVRIAGAAGFIQEVMADETQALVY